MLLRSNSAGSNIGPPRSRPTNLPTNNNLRHSAPAFHEELAADDLLDPAPPLAHKNVVNTHMVHQEASVPCGYPQQTIIHHLNTVSS